MQFRVWETREKEPHTMTEQQANTTGIDLSFEPDRGYSTQQLSDRLGIPAQTLTRWRAKGQGQLGPRFTKLGKSVVYRGSAITEWLADQTQQSAA